HFCLIVLDFSSTSAAKYIRYTLLTLKCFIEPLRDLIIKPFQIPGYHNTFMIPDHDPPARELSRRHEQVAGK
ncbi:MAG TPA: hypothetical protein PLU95_05105, partial [Syntrophales bacterium]|nr:hypothetical protein [Syntrophales bacterium]HPN08660.1 hypothetical protein [Syntrophales bacterium]